MSNESNRRCIQELSLIDDFLFTEAMFHKETAEIITSLILERALGIEAQNLIIETQKNISGIDTDRHGIRMDVSIMEMEEKEVDANNVTEKGETKKEKNKKDRIIRVYDIEPNNMETVNLPKRSRYYQALTDVKLLSSGADYDRLPELVTIWILPYDPFGKNHMIYSVKNIVEGFDDLYYNDGVKKIFLYTDGRFGGNGQLKQLLTYIKNSSKDNVTDLQLEKLHLGVEWLKKSSEIGVKYMQMWEIMEFEKKQSRQEGIEVERKEGIKKSIEMLRNMNISEEDILKQLMKTYELDEKTASEYIYSV